MKKPYPKWVRRYLEEIKSFDENLFDHSLRVAASVETMARLQPISEKVIKQLIIAALVHDIGKTRLPRELFHIGKLTSAKRTQLNTHPRIGYRLVARHSREVAAIMVGHHEPTRRYPRAGADRRSLERAADRRNHNAQLTILHNLLALADTFDALNSTRSYKTAWPIEKIRMELLRLFPESYREIECLLSSSRPPDWRA